MHRLDQFSGESYFAQHPSLAKQYVCPNPVVNFNFPGHALEWPPQDAHEGLRRKGNWLAVGQLDFLAEFGGQLLQTLEIIGPDGGGDAVTCLAEQIAHAALPADGRPDHTVFSQIELDEEVSGENVQEGVGEAVVGAGDSAHAGQEGLEPKFVNAVLRDNLAFQLSFYDIPAQ